MENNVAVMKKARKKRHRLKPYNSTMLNHIKLIELSFESQFIRKYWLNWKMVGMSDFVESQIGLCEKQWPSAQYEI